MKLPSPLKLASIVSNAVRQKESWKRAGDHLVTARDEQATVELTLEAGSNRFQDAKVLREATSEELATAFLKAANAAQDQLDTYWQKKHQELG